MKKDDIIQAEIREDKIHDRFVIVAPGRAKRPIKTSKDGEIKEDNNDMACVFCPEAQKRVSALYQCGEGNNWKVKVIKNIFPAVTPNNDMAYGYQEVIIETPEHGKDLGDLPLDQVIQVMEAYIARTRELAKDKKIQYILIFKNKGGVAGASLAHSHSQIFAAGFTPPHIINKLTKAQEYRIVKGNCYYCDLIKNEEKGPRLIVADEHVLAITPYASNYEYEAWIIPRKHLDNITVLDRQEITAMAAIIKNIIFKLNKEDIPYNMYLHQSILDNDEHFYIRICPRRSVWAGVEMGSRMIINAISPEEAARFYRE
jgi:UDPglucose--hexose-1-phosphate uridylyltransferase